MREHTIAIDMDDTCCDFLGFLCEIHEVYYGENIQQKNIISWELPISLRQTFKELEPAGLYNMLPWLPHAKKALQDFHKEGFKIIFLTARDKKYKACTELFLRASGIQFDSVICSKNKAAVIESLIPFYDIRIFVDDNVNTINSVTKAGLVPHVFLIEAFHNAALSTPKKVKRIKNLKELRSIYGKVKETKRKI